MSALTVASLISALGDLVGVPDILTTEQSGNAYASLQYALNLLDTARSWRYQQTTGSFPTVIDQAHYVLDAQTGLENLGEVKAIWTESPYQRIRKRSHRFYLNRLVDSSGEDPASYYWFDGGARRVRLWPTPASVYTVQILYRRYHGDVTGETCPIYIPFEYKMLVAHLAKQCFNGQISSLDRAMAADPYIQAMWVQMKANETSMDDTGDEDEVNGLYLSYED